VRTVFVGEAWGRREAQLQHALVGPTGRELTLQLGAANFAPYMKLLCRECKRETEFLDGRCTFCHEYTWPNELNLVHHWKVMQQTQDLFVTNVFNEHTPEVCNNCGSHNINLFGKPSCKDCKSKSIRSNDLGWFFSTEKETPMPPWKASQHSRGTHVKDEFYQKHVKPLWARLGDLNPTLIVALGNAACWALLGQTKITTLRGTVSRTNTELTGLDFKVLPSFHPAAVLRNNKLRVTSIADFQKASRERNFPEIRRPFRFITIPAPTQDGLHKIRAWIDSNRHRKLANDIETLRGQISIVGFASSPSNALVIPFRDAHTKDGKIIDIGRIAASIGFPENGINFWQNENLEFQAWKLVQEIEESDCEKIFQNGVYDMSHFIRMGIHPRNAAHDTMLWHHSRYPELPKTLGYLGSIYANDIAWKQMSRADNLKRDE
jgi:uracil-DNA glycosylase